MSILERPGAPEAATVAPARRRAPTGLIVALVIALLAAVTSTTLLFVDQYRTSAEREAIDLVMAYVDAMNGDDFAALQELTTDDVVWSAIADGTVEVGPLRGLTYLDFQYGIPGFRIDVRGEATVLGDQVSLPVQISVGDEEGFVVHTLREVDGELLIAEIVWMPQV
jgi:hypothetical protein